jgi:thiol-disulfide isomerase/thioredoxin
MGNLFSQSQAAKIYRSNSSKNTITSIAQKKILLNSKNIVVLVYSETCPPCQRFKPLFENFIDSYKSKYKNVCSFYKESVSLNFTPEVQYLPSLVFYKKGNPTPVLVEIGSTIRELRRLVHKIYKVKVPK